MSSCRQNIQSEMIKSKLGVGLSNLNKEEWRSLLKYVQMDHSKKSDHFRLLKILNKCILGKKNIENSQDFRANYFPMMSTKSFLNLNSRVFITFEEWLVWCEIRKDKNRSDVLLVKVYNRRGLFSLADKKFSKIQKKLKEKELLSLDTNKNLSDLYYYHHFSENKVKFVQGGSLFQNAVQAFVTSIRELSNLYLLEMEVYGDAINYDFSSEIKTLKEVIAPIPSSSVSLITKRLHNVRMTGDASELKKVFDQIDKEELESGSDLQVLATLYGSLLSIGLFNKGLVKDAGLVFDFYNYSLKTGILTNLGKMTSHKFLNMTTVIIHTQSAIDSELFIRKWIHLVEDEYLESVLNLCLTYVRLKENKYEEMVYLLRSQKYKLSNVQNIAISMEITAFYKLKNWEVLDLKINNFKRRLRSAKAKLPFSNYRRHMKFVKIIHLLAKQNFEPNIKIELSDLDNVFNKTWLMKEISM